VCVCARACVCARKGWKEYRLVENIRRDIINVRQEKIHEVLQENPFNRLAIFIQEMPGSNLGEPDYGCFQDIRQSSHTNVGTVA